jgi:hypothetical protein
MVPRNPHVELDLDGVKQNQRKLKYLELAVTGNIKKESVKL